MNLEQHKDYPQFIRTGNARYTKEVDQNILSSINNHGRPDSEIYLKLCIRYSLRYSQVSCRYNALINGRSVKTYEKFESGNRVDPNDPPEDLFIRPDIKDKPDMNLGYKVDEALLNLGQFNKSRKIGDLNITIQDMVEQLLVFDAANYANGSEKLLQPKLRTDLITFTNNI